MQSKYLAKSLDIDPIPVVVVDPSEFDFIDANPSNFSYGKLSMLATIRKLLADTVLLPPPTSSAVIAAGSAVLTIPGTQDHDLLALMFEYSRNYNVSADLISMVLAFFDKRGAAVQQTINVRPKVESGKILIYFATASQDVVMPLICRNGEIETLTTAPTFQTVATTLTVTCNSNGATVSIVGVNPKHIEVLGILRKAEELGV